MNDEIAAMVAAAGRLLGAGETMEQIIESHPRLTSEQIRAALAYAAESLAFSVALAEDWDRSSRQTFAKDDSMASPKKRSRI